MEEVAGEPMAPQVHLGEQLAQETRSRLGKEHSMPIRVYLSALSVAVCVAGAQASAQSVTTIYVSGGASIPISPELFSDFWNPGYNIGGGVSRSLGSTGRLALQGFVDYSTHSMDEDALLSGAGVAGAAVTTSGGSVNFITVSENLRLMLSAPESKTRPYLMGGAGIFRASASDLTVTGGGMSVTQGFDESETKFGLGFGAGLDIGLNARSGVFVEARYSIGLTAPEATHFLPIRIGIFFR